MEHCSTKKTVTPRNTNNVRVLKNKNIQISKPNNTKYNNYKVLNNTFGLKPIDKKVNVPNTRNVVQPNTRNVVQPNPDYMQAISNRSLEIQQFLNRNTNNNYTLADQQSNNIRNAYRDMLLSLMNSHFNNVNEFSNRNSNAYLLANRIRYNNKKNK